jgi:hypothetical protein
VRETAGVVLRSDWGDRSAPPQPTAGAHWAAADGTDKGISVEITRSQRIQAYLMSRRNLVGMGLALFGIALFALGALKTPFWLLIIVALYLIGVVVTPRDKGIEVDLARRYTEAEIRAELDQLTRKIRRRVPREILQKVESIKSSILSILPELMALPTGDKGFFTIRQTALEYLPTALDNYLKLPPSYATLQPLRNGKTARQLLGEQLDLLDREMKAIVLEFAEDDMQALLAHGRFLELKFQQEDFFVKTPEKQPVEARR